MSGGGRCNILPSAASLDDFHTAGSKMAMRNVLYSWPLPEVRAFFERELSIPLKEEATEKVFPASERPQDAVEALLGECARAGVALAASFRAVEVRRLGESGEGGTESCARFALAGAAGKRVMARRVILATGGLSLPRTESNGGGLAIARALGHSVEPPYPALVPLLRAEPVWKDRAGVSVRTRLRAVRGSETLEEREGDFLFTHRGFSGPVVLDMSRPVTAPGGEEVEIIVSWGARTPAEWEA